MEAKDFGWRWKVGETQPGSAAILHSLSLCSQGFTVSPCALGWLNGPNTSCSKSGSWLETLKKWAMSLGWFSRQ